MESKERYEELIEKIEKLGSIKDVIKNEQLIKAIISYQGDRHLICAFFDVVNKSIKEGILSDYDLEFFRSGKLINLIVNLDDTLQEVNGRKAYRAERLDKINYIGLIEDEETLAVSYTHPVILDALCGEATCDNNPDDLTWWSTCGTYNSLPQKVQSAIILSLLQRGKVIEAEKLLQEATSGVKTYEQQNSSKYQI